ncbi:MAG: hypothetical protein VYE29_14675 [Pseudomonadota bacterium]|nr:hypothetical protein [Pseudomonadota bacterium]
MSPAMTIILINGVILLLCYLVLFPVIVRDNLQKLAVNDLFAFVVAMTVAGSLYMDTNVEIMVMGLSFNWFWFALCCYILLELPLALWYLNKYKLWPPAP